MLQALENFSPGMMAAAELGKGKTNPKFSAHIRLSVHQGHGQEVLKLGTAKRPFFSGEHVVMMHLERYLVIQGIQTGGFSNQEANCRLAICALVDVCVPAHKTWSTCAQKYVGHLQEIKWVGFSP